MAQMLKSRLGMKRTSQRPFHHIHRDEVLRVIDSRGLIPVVTHFKRLKKYLGQGWVPYDVDLVFDTVTMDKTSWDGRRVKTLKLTKRERDFLEKWSDVAVQVMWGIKPKEELIRLLHAYKDVFDRDFQRQIRKWYSEPEIQWGSEDWW